MLLRICYGDGDAFVYIPALADADGLGRSVAEVHDLAALTPAQAYRLEGRRVTLDSLLGDIRGLVVSDCLTRDAVWPSTTGRHLASPASRSTDSCGRCGGDGTDG